MWSQQVKCPKDIIVLELCARQREVYEYGFNDSDLLAPSLLVLSLRQDGIILFMTFQRHRERQRERDSNSTSFYTKNNTPSLLPLGYNRHIADSLNFPKSKLRVVENYRN